MDRRLGASPIVTTKTGLAVVGYFFRPDELSEGVHSRASRIGFTFGVHAWFKDGDGCLSLGGGALSFVIPNG